jgi:prepilin-type N-terminal cleavage/methylation domain-containing protein
MRTFRSTRSGFTLVEILVALAVIAILMGLIGAGIFAVIGVQRRSATVNTMRGINKILIRQVKAVLDKADKEPIPNNVLVNLAGGDDKLARVIWKKLRLKQEFPMTFAEALAPYNLSTYAFVPNPPFVASTFPINSSDLPPLSAYTNALKNVVRGDGTIISANWQLGGQKVTGQPFVESSILLLLALQQNRAGVSVSPDELGSAAVAVQIKNPSPSQPNDLQALNTAGLKMLVDSFGVEIAFFRFPTSNDVASITLPNGNVVNNALLNKMNPNQSGTAATYSDPYDPQGLLVNPNWNNSANNNPTVSSFEQLCHLVHIPNTSGGAGWETWPRYMLPTLVSAGPDGRWGLNSMFSTSYGGYYGKGVNPDISIDPNFGADSTDNIYSYNLGD